MVFSIFQLIETSTEDGDVKALLKGPMDGLVYSHKDCVSLNDERWWTEREGVDLMQEVTMQQVAVLLLLHRRVHEGSTIL